MALEALDVTVNGKPVRLFRGATVRQALIQAGGGSTLLQLLQSGQATVWDETAGAETDLGGALYQGQRLTVRQA